MQQVQVVMPRDRSSEGQNRNWLWSAEAAKELRIHCGLNLEQEDLGSE
jgi:hypothetical protein